MSTGHGRDGLPQEARQVLHFWFTELRPEQWWRDDILDQQIASRFGEVFERLAKGVPDAWLVTPHGVLAAVLVLDQFPRNMFRGTARAFATDSAARRLAENAVDRGLDQALSVDERLFLYLPFEHSEDGGDQQRAVALISALGNAQYTDFARQHKQVIDRFGRFPQRNGALGRVSRPEEEAFLQAGATNW